MVHKENCNILQFTVLISVYFNDNAEYFDVALDSIWHKQKLKPDEVVLVVDGPISMELETVIQKWKVILLNRFTVCRLTSNVGLGDALNIGLKHCRYNLVARMDADDISLPNRFLLLLEEFKVYDWDVVGGQIAEFDSEYHANVDLLMREVPLNTLDIVKLGKSRNPMNHVSVMFKKKSVMDVGGYKKLIGAEDYFLWARLLVNSYELHNISETIVHVRGGNAMVGRRGGVSYLFNDLKLQWVLYKIGFLNIFAVIKNLFIRLPIRLLPLDFRVYIYSFLRKRI